LDGTVEFAAPVVAATMSSGGLMTLAETQARREAEANRGTLEALHEKQKSEEAREVAEARAKEEQEERAAEEARLAGVKRKADKRDKKKREAERSKLTFDFDDEG
jgi:membrane protein involved in colicin uptake